MSPIVREALLLLGFALLVAAAIATVAVPELSEDPDAETSDEREPEAQVEHDAVAP